VTRTVHQRRTRDKNRSHQGKARKEVVYQHFDHRDIGNSSDKKVGHFGIAKFETPTRRKVPSWGPTVSISEKEESSVVWGPAVSIAENQDSRNQESREPMHYGIEKLETLTER
jgi:hypothetical protein